MEKNFDLNLDLDLNLEQDLDLGLNLDLDLDDLDLNEITTQTIDTTTRESSADIDLFDNTFAINFFGITPNVILKEDIDVLSMLILLSDNAESKAKIKSLMKDMEIFQKHLEIKIYKNPTVAEELLPTCEEIFDCFDMKLRKLNMLANELIGINKSNDVMLNNLITDDIDEATNFDNMQSIISYMLSDRFDRTNEIAEALANKYKALLNNMTKVADIVDSYIRLDDATKNPLNSKLTPNEQTLIKLLNYTRREYNYSEKELEAMAYLGFPYKIHGSYEKFFKSDPTVVLEKKKADLAVSKTNIGNMLKDIEKAKVNTLRKYSMQFRRKAYVCNLNKSHNFYTNCLFF